MYTSVIVMNLNFDSRVYIFHFESLGYQSSQFWLSIIQEVTLIIIISLQVSKLIQDHDSPAVRKAAQIAVQVITWKPWLININ